MRLEGMPILMACGVLRLAGAFWGLPLMIYVAVLAALIVVAVLNRMMPGALLLGAGISLNLIAIAANQGMPISVPAAHVAGLSIPADGLHHPMTESTRVPVLVDVIPVPLFRNVYSAGDVVLAVGGFWLPFAALRR